MSISAFINYYNSQIHYLKFGNGNKILFAFHGFSENADSFLILGKSLGKQYTVISIDIPYHGKTIWNEKSHFTKDHLIEFMKLFIEENGCKRFSVLGFSMGGKCALYVAGIFTKYIDDLFLLASDGIQTNKIYNLAVYPKWGRRLFQTTINNPVWFIFLIKTAFALKILSPWLFKFTINHMETKEKRRRLYDTWLSMAEFKPDIEFIQSRLRMFNTNVYMFFGRRDEVIRHEVATHFKEGLSNCSLTILERGHYFIDDKLNPYIEEVLV